MADASEDELAEAPLCRICFGSAESDDPAEQLISPCRCSGSVAYVHCSCLHAWRKQRCMQQGFRRSKHCEMCHAPYRIPRAYQKYFDRELLGGALPGPRHCLHLLADRLRSPSRAAEFALDMWLHAVVLNGFHRGAQMSCFNFNRTLALGFAIIQKNSRGLAAWHRAPMRNRAVFAPLVQLPLALGSVAFLAALSCEVLVISGVSAYVGAIFGFGVGSAGMVHQTLSVSRRLLGLGLRRFRPILARLPLR